MLTTFLYRLEYLQD